MKTLSCVLLLMASFAFVMLGCSDDSAPVVAPADQVVSVGGANGLQKVAQRDISDFLSTQVNWAGWSGPAPDYPLFLAADFSGVINRTLQLGLPSTFDGTITERPLSDGTAEVTIKVRAHNVLTFVLSNADGTLLFGGTPASIFPGWDASGTLTLGEAKFEITFINSALGAPIPDIFQMFGTTSRMTFNSSAFGPLTAASGLGPDGTPGHAWTNQIGMFTKVHGHLAVDGFATENLRLQAVGQ